MPEGRLTLQKPSRPAERSASPDCDEQSGRGEERVKVALGRTELSVFMHAGEESLG